ncbi:MAG: sodium-dependent transporter [Azoarcus sp.]|jgi:NSS family neurotransmitter:Na+ symporter|nr:sodium-dependent transporter [Azoarcus sp.]
MSQSSSFVRSTWSNRWAFVLVTIGSAVGLGNIWRFSYLAGSSGGSAFVLVYLLCVALIGLPLLMAEILIGRRGRGNPVQAMLNTAEETGNSPWWALVGWVGMLGALLILSYYSVVSGWIADYLYQAVVGVRVETAAAAEQGFRDLADDPVRMGFWHTVVLTLSVGVVARGVVAGIEAASRIMMPILFLILVLLTLWGCVVGDMPAALHFMFDFKAEALTPGVVLAAMGHAFFSLSLGMGAIMVYGSYLDKKTSIGQTSLWVVGASTLVGLLSGMAIFSLTFGYGLAPAAGPGLILQTLPLAFAHMPGGRLVAIFFFLFVLFAAWTSAISLVEPFVSWLTERYGIRRVQAAWGTWAPVWLLGLAVCLSFNHWAEFTIAGLNLFDALDQFASKIMMPLSGLAIAIYVGWMMGKALVREEVQLRGGAFPLWFLVLRYVAPLGIVLVFCHNLGWTPW